MSTTRLMPPVADAAAQAGLGGFLLTVPYRGVGRASLFDGGMVLSLSLSRRRAAGQTIRHWTEVASLGYELKSSMEHDVARRSVVTRDTHVLRFLFDEGRPCKLVLQESPARTLDHDFFERGQRSTPLPENLTIRHAVVRVRKAVAEAQAPEALRALRAGTTLGFGRWQASTVGIVVDGRTHRWEDVALPVLGLQPSPNHRHATDASVVLYSRDRSGYVRAPDTEVPDLALLCLLAAEVAPEAHRAAYEAMFP